MRKFPNWDKLEQRVRATVKLGQQPIAVAFLDAASPLQRGEISVEVGDGFYSVEVIFQEDVFVGSVSVFVRKAEADQNTRNLEGVMHLGDERDRAALADENCLLAESFFERGLRLLEDGRVERRDPGLARAEDFEFACHRLGQKLADMLLDGIIKSGDGHAEILVVQLGEEFRKNGQGIRDRAAVDAGMKVAGRAGELDLVII